MSRRQEGREADRGIRTRSAGCENISMRDPKMCEALTFTEKEPASGQESHRSDAVRTELRRPRRSRNGRVVDPGESGGHRGAPEAVRTHRTEGPVSGWHQDGWR